MASSLVHPKKSFKRLESRKSHSWWWDSHASPKNSKWLAENLESMDQGVKRMLKLIEEDGDSFAKKAEMYYQKRPLLVSHVEEFYRMYRALAERYDHVTGELRKNMPSDLQSQGSSISDFGSEPSPEPKPSRRKSDSRAAGFEFFLGTVGSSSDLGNKEDDSSTLDSESESDDSSVNLYGKVAPEINGEEQIALRRKINELEVELRDVKEKVHTQEQEDSSIDSSKGATFENSEDLLARIAESEEETRDAKEKIKLADEEIARLKNELQKYNSHDVRNSLEVELPLDHHEDVNILADTSDLEKKDTEDLGERSDGFRGEVIDPERNMQILEEELVATTEKLQVSEREIAYLRQELENSRSSIDHLQEQLKQTKKETSTWKSKFDKEQREVSKLHDRINRYKNNLSEREQEIRRIRETISNANQVLSEENTLLKSEISNLSKEQNYLQDNLKEWELRCQSLEDEIKRIKVAKTEAEDMLLAEIEQLKEEYKLELDNIMMEKDELDAKTGLLVGEVSSKDAQIEHLDCHLKQLHVEHVELISASETAQRQLKELKSEVEQLEEEVEKQREAISLGAEEKREAIRQLCFSLEHYRTGYHGLRKAFVGQKRLPVMAV